MSVTHIPKPPPQEDLDYFRSLIIDYEAGRVWNARGYEYKSISSLHGRVFVPGKCRKYIQRTYKRYHIVYWAFHGYWPDTLIDHWDHIPYHDWISNLKPSTSRENSFTGTRIIKQSSGKISDEDLEERFKGLLHDQ